MTLKLTEHDESIFAVPADLMPEHYRSHPPQVIRPRKVSRPTQLKPETFDKALTPITINLTYGHNQIAIRGNGEIFATGANSITRLDNEGKIMNTMTSMEQLTDPYGGIAMYDHEQILVTGQKRLQLLKINGVFIEPSGNNIEGQSQLSKPAGIAVDPITKVIYVADRDGCVQVFNASDLTFCKSITLYGEQQMNSPFDVALGVDGFLYVADCDNHCIVKLTPTGQHVAKFGSKGSLPGQLDKPVSLAISNDLLVYVCEKDNHRVSIFNTNGKFLRCFGEKGKGQGQFNNPVCIRINEDKLCVSDYGNKRLVIFRKVIQ